MARDRSQQQALHKVADKVEPRIARAMVVSAARLKERMNLEGLAVALATGNRKAAVDYFSKDWMSHDLQPLERILADTVISGGRLVEPNVNGGE